VELMCLNVGGRDADGAGLVVSAVLGVWLVVETW